ncbi:MAG: hypothetical protein AAF809_07945 [Bacteroidota bacterium]
MTHQSSRAASGTATTSAFAMPAFFAVLLALGLLLTGCDSSEAATEGMTSDTVTLASAVTGVATDAGASSDDLVAAARDFEGRHLEPGTLWYVAAEVHGRLTPEQLTRLEAKLDERRAALEDRRGDTDGRPRGPRGPGGPGGPGGPEGGLFARVLTGDLALTDVQQTAIDAIRETYHAEFEALRASDLADEERRAQAKELAEAMKAEIDAELTEAQLAALAAHKAERKAEHEARRAAEHAAMAAALALTDAQQTDLDALRAEMEAQRGTVDREEARAAFKTAFAEILDDTQEEIVTVHAALRMHLLGPGGRGPRGPQGGRG